MRKTSILHGWLGGEDLVLVLLAVLVDQVDRLERRLKGAS